MKTKIIRAALHVRRSNRRAERVLKRRNVFVEDLILQRASAGGNQDAASAEYRGQQVRERLARTRSGFGDECSALFER